MTNMVMPY
ncbi:unnamed protein product [Gulo gulo]|uniref:Uncharacterized protein n=1 Tax=Gulo gulo TaxID=48420 RepID=A0A9X9M0V7_GULGU|nr:unnamed protein product [Gulo gulo]